MDDKHKYDKAWNWTKVGVSGVSDILGLAKAVKLVKAVPTLSEKVVAGVQEFFKSMFPGYDDYATTLVDVSLMEDEPSLDWLTGLIPIYGTYQAVVDASNDSPIKGVFVKK